MITRNGMIGLSGACLLAAAILAFAPSSTSAGERALVVTPAVQVVTEDATPGTSAQLVQYYYGPRRWGYGYRPYYRPYVYAPPPVVTYGYSYPAYGYGYGYPYYGPAYGPGYGYGGGVGFYGPRVGVGVGIW